MFHAARAAAVQLLRLGYQRATNGDVRGQLAEHRKAIEDASAELPPGWTDERNQVRDYLKKAAAAARRRDL